jgi:hypothetical protein
LKHKYNDVLSQIGIFQFSYEFSMPKFLIVVNQDLNYFLKIGVTHLSFFVCLFWMKWNGWWLKTINMYVIYWVQIVIYPSKGVDGYVISNSFYFFITFFKPLRNEGFHIMTHMFLLCYQVWKSIYI